MPPRNFLKSEYLLFLILKKKMFVNNVYQVLGWTRVLFLTQSRTPSPSSSTQYFFVLWQFGKIQFSMTCRIVRLFTHKQALFTIMNCCSFLEWCSWITLCPLVSLVLLWLSIMFCFCICSVLVNEMSITKITLLWHFSCMLLSCAIYDNKKSYVCHSFLQTMPMVQKDWSWISRVTMLKVSWNTWEEFTSWA